MMRATASTRPGLSERIRVHVDKLAQQTDAAVPREALPRDRVVCRRRSERIASAPGNSKRWVMRRHSDEPYASTTATAASSTRAWPSSRSKAAIGIAIPGLAT